MVLRAPATPVGLVLPERVGRQRYGLRGLPLVTPEGRPLLYTEEIDGRPITVANAIDMNWRIPLDELRGMVQDAARKRAKRGDAQKTAESAAGLRRWWEDRKNWQWDRRNGRVSVGQATFRGNVRNKAAR